MNANIELTPEEEKELACINPQLLEELKSGSPIGKAWIASIRRGMELGEEAQKQATAIRKEVTSSAPEQNSLMTWCGYPTDLTRCSPFFPMNPKELGNRDFLRDFIITSANWGEITYTGPKLSTYEEDTLMALLAILNGVSHHRKPTEVEGKKTYTYKGPALPLLKLLGYTKPSKKDYNRLIRGLKLLTVAGVELTLAGGKTKAGKRREPKKRYMTSMLSAVFWDDDKKELAVTVNPFFYEAYYAKTITMIDVLKRVGLKGSIAKALYRFVQSHKKDLVFTGHFLTLADALNMDREQPLWKTRQMLKLALAELIKHQLLTKKSRFVEQDIILIEREQTTFPEKQKYIIEE
ncbi:hypothetical protein BW722_06430 [Lawsonia intracellularis]|uniref:hypothetical protein n=1 Tax=Lawsonia intracellularis TaxID=29546 RepID=UPI000976C1DD|nr:hypothetical protein [Lawsonia intracellularis]OMQ02025.1 hypothetical protein BW722_06430 [Lawsonia intracellularis]